MKKMSESKNNLFSFGVIFLAVLALGLFLYGMILDSPFHFDDAQYIVNNYGIRRISHWPALWHNLWYRKRLVTFVTFGLNYHFHKEDAFGYHLVNVAIHMLATLCVWWFARLVLLSPRFLRRSDSGGTACGPAGLSERGQRIAFFSALLFLVHPIQTQAVTYISQRFTCLATLFYVLALCLYMEARDAKRRCVARGFYFFLAGLAAFLGMWTKEIVFTLPFVIVLIEVLFLKQEDMASRAPGYRKGLSFVAVFLGVGAFLFILPAIFSFDVKSVFMGEPEAGVTGLKYSLTQPRVIITYLRLLFLPVGQNLDYDFPVARSLWEWPTLASVALIIFALMGAVKMLKKNVLAAFGIFWFFIALSVESTFIPIRDVIAEHRLYLPSIGFCFFVVAVLDNFLRGKRGFMLVMSILTGSLAMLTIQRNQVWRDGAVLWQDVVKKSPDKARGYLNLGGVYLSRGDYSRALENFNRVLAIDPKNEKALNNRGYIFREMGDFEKALEDFNRALEIAPQSAVVYDNRGLLYQAMSRYPEALADFNEAIRVNPEYEKAYNNRGDLYAKMWQLDKAIDDFTLALTIHPDFVKAYNNRGVAYLLKQRLDLALADFNQALAIAPAYAPTYNNRGSLFAQSGQLDDALRDFNRAIELSPRYASAYYNRAILYQNRGDFKKALDDALMALSLGEHVADEQILRLRTLSKLQEMKSME